MSGRAGSFSRDAGKLYLLYLAAGLAAVPAGVAYALLAVNGYDRWWTALPAIALGLWTATRVWKFLEGKLYVKSPATAASLQPVVLYSLGYRSDVAGTAAAVALCAVLVVNPLAESVLIGPGGARHVVSGADMQIPRS